MIYLPHRRKHHTSGSGDPYFANVSLLLHGGGADGSTTFTDSSSQANTLTRVGDTQIDTAQSKFGGSSILFDGTSDALYCDGGSEFSFGTGDFTIEFWLRFNAISPANPIIVDWRSAASIHPYIGYISGALVFVANSGTRITGPSLSLATWYHIAVSRVSGTTRMFVDGTQVGSDYTDANNYGVGTNRPLFSGDGAGSGNTFNGWLDEIRITKGVGRYTTNFTAPTEPFPDA